MAHSVYDRTIAFAGLCQAVKLVQKVAKDGHCDHDALETSLNSIIVTDSANTVDIFGSESQLRMGLKTLTEIDGSPSGNDMTRYLMSVLVLERKLASRRDSMQQLGDRIDTAKRQVGHFELMDDQMISNLASIYLDIISPLGPRIQVTGTPAQLQQQNVQHKVRALLLAAIRAAVLWRQVGGKRRHLIFGRKQMTEQAKILLARS
ncbi:high frequency lysogenization protein HflD [Photobacterium japonica]|uniref:high frequency lysogenization protein HflD n=1 Tax=Photobacterium japonica TaxID=2910235 RepID=UPI003D10F8CC